MDKRVIKVDQNSPFHRGEQVVQSRLGVRNIADWARQVIRDYLPEQHREFYAAQSYLIVSARDKNGNPWVTMLHGGEGFVSSPNPYHLVINAKRIEGDALHHAFQLNADVGVLGIELVTRRRNRVNGRVVAVDTDSITLRVEQSFGNCPQHIRERAVRRVEASKKVQAQYGLKLSVQQKTWIANADTLFIASGYRSQGESESFGMDASHRGGERGFVQVVGDSRLRFPDFAGNNHFNTIGNLVLDPRVGLLFIDFETGSLLQVSGTATIDWHPEESQLVVGARRVVEIAVNEVIELTDAVPLRWQSEASSVRSLRVAEKIKESRDVTSFILRARDGGPLAGFEPGQHLPIELSIDDVDTRVSRTYSISSSPNDEHYRITVKREPQGLASRHLHDHIEPGAIIQSRSPAGDFMMTCNVCPLVLVSAGVGVTPMVSILKAATEQPSDRPVWFIHGARDAEYHPLAQEVRDLASRYSNVRLHVAYSRARFEDVLGADFHSHGHVDGELLAALVNDLDAHYFLCGPKRFMADIQADLERRDIPTEQIHYETFGPMG